MLEPEGEDVIVTTSLRLKLRLWNVLRSLAADRALSGRGRPSNASVLRELIEEAEAKREREKADA